MTAALLKTWVAIADAHKLRPIGPTKPEDVSQQRWQSQVELSSWRGECAFGGPLEETGLRLSVSMQQTGPNEAASVTVSLNANVAFGVSIVPTYRLLTTWNRCFTGDSEFDAQVGLVGDPALCLSIMDAPMRTRTRSLIWEHGGQLLGGRLQFPGPSDPVAARGLLSTARELLERLGARTFDRYRRLLTAIYRDPVPGFVKVAVDLKASLSKSTLDTRFWTALIGVALEVGERGIDDLRLALGTPSVGAENRLVALHELHQNLPIRELRALIVDAIDTVRERAFWEQALPLLAEADEMAQILEQLYPRTLDESSLRRIFEAVARNHSGDAFVELLRTFASSMSTTFAGSCLRIATDTVTEAGSAARAIGQLMPRLTKERQLDAVEHLAQLPTRVALDVLRTTVLNRLTNGGPAREVRIAAERALAVVAHPNRGGLSVRLDSNDADGALSVDKSGGRLSRSDDT